MGAIYAIYTCPNHMTELTANHPVCQRRYMILCHYVTCDAGTLQMYWFLPIDRFLRMRSRTRSRTSPMYLNHVVSQPVSSFELVVSCLVFSPITIYYTLFRSCRTNLVSPSHVTLSQNMILKSVSFHMY
jgi:hypothetical protein